MKGFLAALAVLALALSGCMVSYSTTTTSTATHCFRNGATVPCEPAVAAPKVSARRVLDGLKEFSEAFPYRQSGSPTHLAARDDLAARFEAAGLEVLRQAFPSGVGGNPATGGNLLDYDGENIIGVKWGSDRGSFIVVGAHYDVTEGAVHGAYDDGSGTLMVAELAAAFAGVPTNRTILFTQFDQEELGLVGSAHFLEQVESGSFPYNGTVDGMIDLDMVGITWPHPAHLVAWENSPALEKRIRELANGTGMPAGHLEFRETLGGSSDGVTFLKAGIPTAYLWSDWDQYVLPDGSTMPRPGISGYLGSYPWWHKADTYETMAASAGGEQALQAGFQTTLDIVSPLLYDMARTDFVLDLDA